MSNKSQSPSPSPRWSYSITYDSSNDLAILFGGFAPGFKYDDTWSWNGMKWDLLSEKGPVARDSGAISYHPNDKKVYLYGGHAYTDEFLEDTWVWDGKGWRELYVPGPPARNHAAMIYFPPLKKSLLFGGRTKSKDLGESWTWDGETWENLNISGPPPRDGFRMVYHEQEKKILLFGGRFRTPNGVGQFNDTWAWDGDHWELLSETGPGPRSHSGMYYDSDQRAVLLHGGENNETPHLSDLWKWDGSSWRRVDEYCPPSRSRTFIVYIKGKQQTLLFGGSGPNGACGDTWLNNQGKWQKHE